MRNIDSPNIKFRKKLRELREKNNYSLKVMSEATGLCRSYYWQIENGQRGLTYENAKKIAKVFNLRPDDIFFDD